MSGTAIPALSKPFRYTLQPRPKNARPGPAWTLQAPFPSPARSGPIRPARHLDALASAARSGRRRRGLDATKSQFKMSKNPHVSIAEGVQKTRHNQSWRQIHCQEWRKAGNGHKEQTNGTRNRSAGRTPPPARTTPAPGRKKSERRKGPLARSLPAAARLNSFQSNTPRNTDRPSVSLGAAARSPASALSTAFPPHEFQCRTPSGIPLHARGKIASPPPKESPGIQTPCNPPARAVSWLPSPQC